MKKKDFLAQYQTKEWYNLSKRIKARDNNTCQMCGCNNKPLSVHHLCYRDGNILNNNDDELITLCEDCHKEQSRRKIEVYELVNDLRTIYTDYEIANALANIYYGSVSDGPVMLRSVEPSKKFSDVFDLLYDDKIERLNAWRKKIRLKEYKETAI